MIKDCTNCLHEGPIDKEKGFRKYDKKKEPCCRCIFIKVKSHWESRT